MAFRVALVGLGMAATPHAKSLQDLAHRVEVAYAYSPSAERRREFAKRFAFRQCERLETILEDRSVDAVLILTPPNTHLELVTRFAEAGKHILLEKPLEISTARAEELVRRCSRIHLGVVLQHRFRPAAVQLRRDLPDLGKIVAASAQVSVWRPQTYYDQPGRGARARDGGGVLLTQGIHTLDLLLSFAGEPAEVKAFSSTTPIHRMETEDLVCAAVRWKSGALGVVQATTCAYPGYAERIELVGVNGTAQLEGTALRMQLQDGTSRELKTPAGGGGTGADPMAFPHDWHRGVLADFLEAMGENRPPRVSGAEALKVHRFIDALLQEPLLS